MEKVEEEANRVEDLVETVENKSKVSFGEVLAGLHAGWLATQGFIRAAGGSVSTVFRAVVGSTLGAISMLVPVLSAAKAAGWATMNPWVIAQATMGLASIGVSIGALVAAEQKEREFSDALRGANMAIHGIQSLIGTFHFL